MIWVYIIIAIILLAFELIYFEIADKCNIIDKPNERSSHTTIVLRGGGIIFTLSMMVWAVLMQVQEITIIDYFPFLIGLLLIAGVSFWDDVHSLPDTVRLVAQFVAMALMFWSIGILHWCMWWMVLAGLIICVGATNIINFMDGINGITAGYALAVLLPLLLLNGKLSFINDSYLIIAIIGVLVFCISLYTGMPLPPELTTSTSGFSPAGFISSMEPNMGSKKPLSILYSSLITSS